MDLPVELVGLLKHAGIDGKKLTWDLQVDSIKSRSEYNLLYCIL
jgi:hypothetical protein